jgi:hypothetical protein
MSVRWESTTNRTAARFRKYSVKRRNTCSKTMEIDRRPNDRKVDHQTLNERSPYGQRIK